MSHPDLECPQRQPAHICEAPREGRLLLRPRAEVAPIYRWHSALLSSLLPISVILAWIGSLVHTNPWPVTGSRRRCFYVPEAGCLMRERNELALGLAHTALFTPSSSTSPDISQGSEVPLPPNAQSTEGGAPATILTLRWSILSKGVDLKVCAFLLSRSSTEHKPGPVGLLVVHPPVWRQARSFSLRPRVVYSSALPGEAYQLYRSFKGGTVCLKHPSSHPPRAHTLQEWARSECEIPAPTIEEAIKEYKRSITSTRNVRSNTGRENPPSFANPGPGGDALSLPGFS